MRDIINVPTAVVVIALVIGGMRRAEAQAVVVQQPVVEQFGVRTVVSVPDRGSALLGSVSSSTMIARRSGFGVSGVNLSRQQRHSGASVHVWIHDFEAMDAALLAAGSQQRQQRHAAGGSSASLSGMSAVASDQLLRQHKQIARRQPIVEDRPSSLPPNSGLPDAPAQRLRSHQAAAGSTVRRFGSRTFK